MNVPIRSIRPGTRKVLVGMTNAARRAALTRGLRDAGHRVIVAQDGYHLVRLMSEALLDENDATERPDLIIADVTMPGCSGMTILDGIRQLEWETPVFLIVDFNQPEVAAMAFARGADRVFDKPIDVDDVRAAANAILVTGRTRMSAAIRAL